MSVDWRAVGMELALFGDRAAFFKIIEEIPVNRLTDGTLALTIGLRSQITSPSATSVEKSHLDRVA